MPTQLKSSNYINKGIELFQQGEKCKKPQEAINFYQRAIAQFDIAITADVYNVLPDDLENALDLRANYYKACALEKLQKFNEAVQCYSYIIDKAYLLDPLEESLSHQLQLIAIPEQNIKVMDVLLRRALVYYQCKSFEQASKDLTLIVKEDSTHFYANIHLALIYINSNQLFEATAFFNRTQTEVNQINERLKDLEREVNDPSLIEDYKKLSLTHLYQGYMFYRQKNIKDAILHFKQAVGLARNQQAQHVLAKLEQLTASHKTSGSDLWAQPSSTQNTKKRPLPASSEAPPLKKLML